MARQDSSSVYICAVWLTKARRWDVTDYKLWSQNLNCTESFLKNLVEQCRSMRFKNDTLKYVWEQLSLISADRCKVILKESRKLKNLTRR